MKRGFTLAELLITLGIIGVISALLGVAITKLKPDEDKATFLKQYDAVRSVTGKVVRDSRLYPICQNMKGENNWDCGQHPLFNIAETNVGGKSISGAGKYCDILATMLGGKKLSDNSCTLNPTYADGSWTPTFTTKNGAEWLISTTRSTSGSADSGYRATYQTEIYFDINGAKAPNCLYEKNKCETPDRFKLLVAADGTVLAADPMGQTYRSTRKNWNKKELEIEDNHVVAPFLDANLRYFTLNTCGKEMDNKQEQKNEDYLSKEDDLLPSKYVSCALTVFINEDTTYGNFSLFCGDSSTGFRDTGKVKYKFTYSSFGDSNCSSIGLCTINNKSLNDGLHLYYKDPISDFDFNNSIYNIYLDSDDASGIVLRNMRIVHLNTGMVLKSVNIKNERISGGNVPIYTEAGELIYSPDSD